MTDPTSNQPTPAPPPIVAPPAPAPPATGKPPISKVCPHCGGQTYTRVAPSSSVAFAKDRVCKQCGTRYSPPTPLWAAIIFIVIGAFLTLFFGVVCIPVALRLYNGGASGSGEANVTSLICPLTMCILGVLSLVQGIRAIVTKP